jgi:ubiquinone/menaquinone biosynthesis C-methylase UbiE
MATQDRHAHGVTPGLSQDYAGRTAERQAAFLLPYLQPGMDLLDVGCGPGTITLGLAQAVAPGQVTGIDHDAAELEAARALAAERGVTNVRFEMGDARSLPFEDGTFDAAYENDLFVHLASDAVQAAGEVYRVLKPGGLFGARDVETDSVVWGNPSEALKELDALMQQWQHSRGSDVRLGKHLPTILRQAGFSRTIKSVSADTKGTLEGTRARAQITVSLLDGPFGRAISEKGWGDASTVARLKQSIRAWGEHPDAFFANVHVEVAGWKPI